MTISSGLLLSERYTTLLFANLFVLGFGTSALCGELAFGHVKVHRQSEHLVEAFPDAQHVAA